MLNEEKVRYMTELAIFEKNQGRRIFPVNRFFKSDYVGGQMFRAFFGYTFSFFLILLTWGIYKLDVIMGGAEISQIHSWITNGVLAYGGGLFLYLMITWRVSARRYDIASRTQTMFTARLRHLVKRYERQAGCPAERTRGGRTV